MRRNMQGSHSVVSGFHIRARVILHTFSLLLNEYTLQSFFTWLKKGSHHY